MKIPYMREVILICIGLNLSFFAISVGSDNDASMWLALASGSMCGFGLWADNRWNRNGEEK